MKRRRTEVTADVPAVTLAAGMKTVPLHYPGGRPLQAGDLREGETVTFDMRTGEVRSIKGESPCESRSISARRRGGYSPRS